MLKWLQRKTYGDPQIWLIVFILSGIGMLAVYSSTSSMAYKKASGNMEFYLVKHLIFLMFGIAMMFLTQLINYKYYSRLSQLLLYLAVVLLPYTLFFGVEINNAPRWLMIPGLGLTFQTSDLAKLAIIMYMARSLSKRQEDIDNFKKSFVPLFIWVALICLLILPANLSTAAVLFFTCMLVMFIGRVPLKYLSLVFVGILIAGAVAIFIVSNISDENLKNYGRLATWKGRIERYIPKNEKNNIDANDGDYQMIQAKIAVAKGGIIGVGPGRSTQKNFLPNPFSDFIYAIIIEEYGFVMAIVMVLLYLWLLMRCIRIVSKAPKAFGALLAIGLAFALVMQAFINMAVAVSLFPVTGLALPLVSMGGTSVLFNSIAFGIILSVSRTIEEQESDKLEEAVVSEIA